jgi:hypothetical protein
MAFAETDPATLDFVQSVAGSGVGWDLAPLTHENAGCASMAGRCFSFIPATHEQTDRSLTQTSSVFADAFVECQAVFHISETPPPRA